MRKLCVILLVLALPTLVVTFWWIVTGAWFNWIDDGLRCGGALIGNFFALIVAFIILLGAEDSEIKEWTDGWKMRP